MRETALINLARWASSLTLEQVPSRVRDQAINQVLSTLSAVYSGWDSDLGNPIAQAFPATCPGSARVIPTGAPTSISQAAFLMSAWSMVLDFDDVMLGGHTGHSSVLVPLAIGSAGGRSGGEILLAQIVANEIAARINMVCAVGSTRGQMATHVHLIAAAAARAKLENLDETKFAEALSFALSYPSQALFPAFLGSDAKTLCAAMPIRVGIEAVDAVESGFAANIDLLDDPRGFFATMARYPVREFLSGLGQRWHTETNSFKVYPACGYLCSAIDATLDLVLEHDICARDVASVDVWASLFTVGMDDHSQIYIRGPRSSISTLTFSTPFVIASAILARDFGPAQLKRSWIADPRVWDLASRVRSRHDVELTLKSMTGDIPIGAALCRTSRWRAAAFGWSIAGKAFGWWGRLRRPEAFRLLLGLVNAAGQSQPLDFERSAKPMGARVEMHLLNGTVLTRSVTIPKGFAGSLASDPGGSGLRQLMRKKFSDCAGTVIGARRAVDVLNLLEKLDSLSASELKVLIDLSCIPASDGFGPHNSLERNYQAEDSITAIQTGQDKGVCELLI